MDQDRGWCVQDSGNIYCDWVMTLCQCVMAIIVHDDEQIKYIHKNVSHKEELSYDR